MRICFVHNAYGAYSGEEHSAEVLARLLESHEHEVRWFCRSSAEIGPSWGGKVKAFFSGIHNPSAARSLAEKLEEIRPDLVQVQNLYPLLSPSIFGPLKARSLPVVMRCPNYRLFCPTGLHLAGGRICERCLGWGRESWCLWRNCMGDSCKSAGYALRNAWARISGRILRNVDMFIVQTEFQKQKFVERGIPASKIGVVPGLVPCQGPLPPEEDGHLVAFVGRVSPEKGIEDFIAIARLLPEIPFAVAGSEAGMPGIRETAPANVRWLGFQKPNELRELYLHSRIVVVPSRCYEGFPNVVTEAMTYARPVVATDIGALSCIVRNGETGVLVRASAPRDAARQLSALYGDPALCRRLGRAGRAEAMARYSPESVYRALMAVYAQAMRYSGRRPARKSCRRK